MDCEQSKSDLSQSRNPVEFMECYATTGVPFADLRGDFSKNETVQSFHEQNKTR